jgi:hypothetical protein
MRVLVYRASCPGLLGTTLCWKLCGGAAYLSPSPNDCGLGNSVHVLLPRRIQFIRLLHNSPSLHSALFPLPFNLTKFLGSFVSPIQLHSSTLRAALPFQWTLLPDPSTPATPYQSVYENGTSTNFCIRHRKTRASYWCPLRPQARLSNHRCESPTPDPFDVGIPCIG